MVGIYWQTSAIGQAQSGSDYEEGTLQGSGEFDGLWAYVLGPVVGGVLAALRGPRCGGAARGRGAARPEPAACFSRSKRGGGSLR